MLNESNFTKLLGEINGPPDTPYEGLLVYGTIASISSILYTITWSSNEQNITICWHRKYVAIYVRIGSDHALIVIIPAEEYYCTFNAGI